MKKLCALFVLCFPFCLFAQAPDLDTADSLIQDSFDSLTIIESENENLSEQLSVLRSEMRNWSEASEAQKAEWMRQLEMLNNRWHEAEAQQKKSEASSQALQRIIDSWRGIEWRTFDSATFDTASVNK